MQPTEKQKNALKNFGYSLIEINKMSFEDANHILKTAIAKAKERDANKQSGNKANSDSPPQGASTGLKYIKEVAEVDASSSLPINQVASRVEQAKNIALKQIPEAESYQDYLALVTEILHQLGSSEWLELERRKLKARI